MWTSEQLQAIENQGTNIIVSAGAGSGKTAVLTERVIRKLKQGININELLILTFTDAASKEMKERIREAIKKEGTLEKQLDLLTTAYICTFDSFSLSIVKKYHYLLNIDSNVAIMDNNINKLECKRILDSIFEKYYADENKEFGDLIAKWCVKDDDNVKNGILSIYEKINLLVEKEDYLDNYINNQCSLSVLEKHYQEYQTVIKENIKKFISLCDLVSPYMKEKDYNNFLIVRNLMESITLGLEPITSFDERIVIPKIYNAPDEIKKIKKDFNQEIKKIKALFEGKTKEEQFQEVLDTVYYQKTIIKIINELDERLNQFKAKTNTYTFTDIAKMAIKVVKDNQSVKDELKNTLKEIMVDEYQDTSDIQEYFINLIANNNVYMVGDIKQSIYRFRNANPYLFQKKYDDYKINNGGIKIDLTKNFRSRKEVVTDINNIFNNIMTQEIGGANYKDEHNMFHGNTAYNEIAKTINHDADVLTYEADVKKRLSKEEIEAFIIAKDIKDKIDNHYQVMDKKTKQSRNVLYSDFVILLGKSKHFEMYKRIFNFFQIPLNIYKNDEIKDDYDIKLINNILKLVVSQSYFNFSVEDKYALTSILRSYLFNFTDDQIFKMFINNDFYNNEAYNIILEIRNQKDQIAIKEILELIDDKFGIIAKANKITNIKNVLVHLEYLSNLSDTLSNLGYTLADYSKYLNEIFDNDLKIEYQNKLSTVDNAVKIMTIHKSKGLEFGICYFPTLHAHFNFEDTKKEFVFDKDLGIIIPQINYGKKDTFLKAIYSYQEKKQTISEEIRVLYVALTRAKEKIIFVTEQPEADIKVKIKSFADLLSDYIENHNYQYINEEQIEQFVEMNNTIKKLDINFLNSSNDKLNVLEIYKQKQVIKKQSFSKTIENLITDKNKELLSFGTLIHQSLERIDFKTKDLSVLDLDSKYHHYIVSFLNSDLLKNVEKGKVYKEYQFYDDINKVNGSIDLMIEYDNYIDIIDYKLKHIEDEGYLKQLNGYKNFINLKTNKTVNIYLYSIIDKKYKVL